jgi:hypothetical protein
VVHREQQDVLLFAEAEEHGPEQRPFAEVERLPRLAVCKELRFGFALLWVAFAGQVYQREREWLVVFDDLHRLPVYGVEAGAERLVAADDLVEAALDRLDVEPAVEPERDGDVVERAAGFEPVNEPEPLLRVRQGQRL